MVFIFRKWRTAENEEDTSDSWFGYRTLLPVYAVCAACCAFSYATFALFGIMLIFCYMGYRRGTKLHKSDWAVIAVYFLLALIMCNLGK